MHYVMAMNQHGIWHRVAHKQFNFATHPASIAR
jgi:hypothetical protein